MEQNTSNNQLNLGALSDTISSVGKAVVFKQTFKIKAILITIGLLIVAGLVWLIYRSGLKKGKADSVDYNQLPLPNTGTPESIKAYKEWLQTTGTTLANQFYQELGFTWTNAKINELIYTANQLDDQKLIGLNNIYNLAYADENRRLVPDLKAKVYVYYGDDQRNLFVKRLENLGSR